MMQRQFYIAVNGQQTGPFTIEDLNNYSIKRDTLVWTEGLESWTKADNIEDLKEVLRSVPPAIPSNNGKNSSQVTPPISNRINQNQRDNYYGYELAPKSERLIASFIDAILILIPIILFFDDHTANEILQISPYSIESMVGYTILSAILGVLFYPLWGGNLGHKLLGLVVISTENGEVQYNWKAGVYRETLKSLFTLGIIPVVWLIWDKNNQNLYDKVVKTYVVRIK